MTRLIAFLSRLGFAWARRRLDAEARAEFDAHVELLRDRYVRSGMAPDDARSAARKQFGNHTWMREEVHRMNGIGWLDSIAQDFRYALRQIRRAPGFSVVVIATLALGIGGTTAVFSVVRAVLLAPLPYDQPGRLVRFYQQEPGNPSTQAFMAATHFGAMRDRAGSFENVSAIHNYSEKGLDLVRNGRGQRIRVLEVTSDYFQTLRSNPRGPGFDRRDETGTHRVILSDRIWRQDFGADPAVIGSAIQLSGHAYDIVGIAPARFADPIAGDVDAWVPYDLVSDTHEENTSLSAVGRLRPGVALEQARAELEVLSRALKERWPAPRLSSIVAHPLQETLVASARPSLQLLLLAVGLVLLAACVNVANLMLVRATGRVHEFAIRAAIGSSRTRIVGQLLMESGVLAFLGGLAGFAIASLGVSALQRLGQDAIPRIGQVGFDPIVLGTMTLVTIGAAILSGIMPALRCARGAPNRALREQSRSATGTRWQARVRGGLATAQLALALTVLVGAGVLVASFHQLHQVDLGFRSERVLTFDMSVPSTRYDDARRAVFQEELARRLETISGVTAAGGISFLPAAGSYHGWNTFVRTGPRAGGVVSRRDGFAIQQRTISGDALGALEIPLLAGRPFDDRDDAAARPRAVVSANFARAAFPGLSLDAVIGQRIATVGQELDIIGVVGDVALDVYGAPTLVVYHAHRQFASNRNWTLTQVVATNIAPEQILSAVRAEVAAIDPQLVVHRAAPLAEVIGRGVGRQRFALVLMAVFGGVALALAALGLYGVLAYSVRERTQEIGIRMALGATAGQVRGLVLRQASVVVGLGLAFGIGGALLLGRWLSALVFKTNPWDPRILVATAVVLAVTALLAAWLPARRASRVEPKIAMQN